jgi:hypothetical protein
MSKRGCSAGCAHEKKALRGVGGYCQNPACAREATLGISFALPASSPCPDIATSSSIFFEQAFRQHSAVEDVTRIYDRLYRVHRRRGLAD